MTLRDLLARVGGLPTSIGIGLLAFFTALPFARLDFDPHHDGVMVAAAVAVRDGLVVQRDAFAQYGPVSPILQGWVLKLGLDPVLGIRLLNVLAIALVAFALADLGRKAPQFWPISLSAGRWASLAWLILADFFLWVPQLPWSSTLGAALAAVGLLMVGRTLHSRETGGYLRWQVPAVVAGCLVAVLPFARINVGLTTIALGGLVAALAFLLVPSARALVWWFAGSWVVGTGSIAVLLLVNGALVAWWHQAIVWPLSWASEVGSQLGPDVLLQEITRAFWVALVAIAVIVIMTPWKVKSTRRAPTWVALLSLLTSVGLLLGLYRNPGLERIFLADQRGVRESFIDGLTRSSLVLLTLFVAVVLLVATIRAIQASLSLIRRIDSPANAFAWLTVIAFALGGIVQYAPVPDSRHIWWGLPLGLALIFASFGRSRLWLPTRNPLVLALTAAAVAALLSGRAYLSYERAPGPAGSVAEGILSQAEMASRVKGAIDVLQTNVGSAKAVFLVAEGAWSVFDGSYHSPDAYFVDWGAPFDVTERLSTVEWAVTDDLARDRNSEALHGLGFRQVAEGGGLQVWSNKHPSESQG